MFCIDSTLDKRDEKYLAPRPPEIGLHKCSVINKSPELVSHACIPFFFFLISAFQQEKKIRCRQRRPGFVQVKQPDP